MLSAGFEPTKLGSNSKHDNHLIAEKDFRAVYCVHHQGTLIMEAVIISEMSVSISTETTMSNIPGNSHLNIYDTFLII
jgi:hypothetical protein